MGHFYKDQIEQAGMYLLEILSKEQQISFDFFYDGSDKKHKLLCEVFGIAENNDDSIVEILLDIAAAELEEFGIVSLKQLGSKLFDGEPNYQIKLTAKGRKVIDSKQKIDFYSTTE